ncbi:MAG: Pantoate--beta-alanine ligase [Ktedonobacterales bacterium]|nr:MAG: Pantoate--beta-alanine ligase [Ktedonobacterales bacterium]
MRVITTLAELAAAREAWMGEKQSCGFVPTMGYLHAGHLSLVEQARSENEVAVVSIFVNPAQFAPSEDLSRYPRDLPHDLALLEAAGTDIVFTPAPDDIYPPDFNTYVVPSGALAERLEAAVRPGHFRGVATVVLKLFNLVQPSRAYFGQKDAQQVAVLRRMLTDLNVPVELLALPTIREADGLAMSSRNSYLGAEDRLAATALFRALQAAAASFNASADTTIASLRRTMIETVAAEPRATLDYADVCDPATFEPLAELRAPMLLAIAARVGPARLIDNVLLNRDGSWNMGRRIGGQDSTR